MKTLLDFFKNNKIIAILILLVSIPIVLYPRFDMQDISLVKPFVGVPKGELTPDQRNYLHFVEYFRGEMPLDSCHAPYSFRPLVPFTASLLPFKPMTSINIVNTFSVILTVIFIFLTLKRLHFDFELRIVGCLLYVISFPTFYYSTTGHIDATATMLLFAIVLARISERDWALMPLMILAALAKETSLILFPFLLLHLYLSKIPSHLSMNIGSFFKMLKLPKDKNSRLSYIYIWSSLILYLGSIYAARLLFGTFGDGSYYFWYPTLEHLADNIFRFKTYFSLLISFGFPGLLSLLYLLKMKNRWTEPLFASFMIGIIVSLLLWFYSYISAYADGRFIWTAYPFMVPVAIRYLQLKTSTLRF